VRGAEEIYVAAAEMVDARVVREQAEAFAGDEVGRIRQHDLDPGTDLSYGG